MFYESYVMHCTICFTLNANYFYAAKNPKHLKFTVKTFTEIMAYDNYWKTVSCLTTVTIFLHVFD